ncbi:Tc toxin subunit A [Xenorhabdus japonica]|uniref:Virulence plasmid A protein n=1 Tax=Xenorhabdus japonica TaxID=53341 RepID=A0A1I5BHL0_9GAMM|nr:Tc toxin subunit A [Xenorhabdus japonica]SFN74059.1 virulence plasmid A protein [Xenorhabdus japonica]
MANKIESRISYKTLFNDNQDLYCFPGLPEANDGPLAYLVDLYQQIRIFEKSADKDSARFLNQRRPDIEKLLLDSTNLNKTSKLLPIVIEALAEKVQAHINKKQPLPSSLAEIHYPLSLPFHFPLKQTTAVLAEKEISLLDLIQQADSQYPNFIDGNLSVDSLQTAMMISSTLAPKLQALLLAESQSNQKDFFDKYYGLKGDASEAAVSLSRLTVFTQQTGLNAKEVERLFAVNGISENTVTHSTVVYSSNVAKPENTDKDFPSGANYAASYINAGKAPALYQEKTKDKDTAKDVIQIKGVNNDRFDRIQRFLHIQKALKLSYEHLDLLLTTACQAEKQTEFLITKATLRVLGVFLHFQQEYNTTAEQFAAFIGHVTPYSLEEQRSFFDRLFNTSGLSQQAASSSVLVLDNQEFDPNATEGPDALTLNQLCNGLNIDDATCQILLSFVVQAQGLQKPKRSLNVVSALYRLVALPRLLHLSVKEGLGLFLLLNRDNKNYLQQLAGIPVLAKDANAVDILDVLIAVMNATQWVKRHKFSPLSLNLLLTPYQSNGNIAADIENIDWIRKIRSVIPDASSALLSEDKIASAMQGFQAKKTPIIWMTALAKLVDEKLGIVLNNVIATDSGTEKEVSKILKELAQDAAWEQQGDTWTQTLTTLLINAFIAQQDLIINAVSHAFNIDSSLSVPLLKWTGNSQADFLRNTIALARRSNDQQQKAAAITAWYDLNRYATICDLFKLTEKSIQTVIDHPDWFKLNQKDGKLRALDLTFLHRLSRYGDWLNLLPENKTEDDVIYYLHQANQVGQNPPVPNAWTAEQAASNLAGLIGWTEKEVLRAASYFDLKVAQNAVGVSTIMRLKALAEKSEISAQPLLDVAKLTTQSSYNHWNQVSSALFAVTSSKIQAKLEGSLNEIWRDALIEYLLRCWAPSDNSLSDITTIEDLSNYFLTDVQVAAEVDTSRVAFCIASLQRYLFRLFSHLEIGYDAQPITDERIEYWNRYLSQYSHWQVWQMQRNFPENFIDPAHHLRKTRAFADLENDLGQSRLNNDMIQTAILRYLTEFERISNLQIISGYIDGTDPKNDHYHFVGKNNAEPVEYYWRSLDINIRDSNNVISPLAWSEWEKITLSLSGTLLAIRPIVISGRQYAIWVEREATPLMGVDQKPTDYRAINVKFTFKQSNGEWSAPNELFRLDGTDANGEYPTTEGKRVPDKDNPYLKDEKYKPALIAMVDVQRKGDPWMGVLLYDTEKKDSSAWVKNKDYYLELRDLLLVDKKSLNQEDEKKLVTTWHKLFSNPDTLQHHYAGTDKFVTTKVTDKKTGHKFFSLSPFKSPILTLDVRLDETKTKLLLTGKNTLVKRNIVNNGTKPINPNKLPTKDLLWTINTNEIHIEAQIPASDTGLKTFNFEWKGRDVPTDVFTISYDETKLFQLLPNEWKDYKITKSCDLSWVNGDAFQLSTQWDIGDDKKLSISIEGNNTSIDSAKYATQGEVKYAKSHLILATYPEEKALFTKELSLNGQASTGEIEFPLKPNINKYFFNLATFLMLDPDNPKDSIVMFIENIYEINLEDGDKISSITLQRNEQQAQYLDIKTLDFNSTAIRLNTLFGKQLVSRATQSIERVLAWDTQSLPEPALDDKTSPTKVDFNGANGQYFWELFFHLPFLVSARLREEQRFYDSRRWFINYLFDPYGSIRMWNSRPIIESGSNLPPSIINADPDTVAYSQPIYYQKSLFHFLIKLWIQEGDNLYRQLTRDSLNEAGLCYQQALQLLGTLPEGLDATRWHPVTLDKIKTNFQANSRAVDSLFMSPFNTQLIELQKTLENRLYNLRHGLTLDGKVLPLPLYASATDPDSLMQRNAGYVTSILGNMQQQVPPYRFPIMLKRANAAVKQLIEMGHRLLQAIESEVNAEQEVLEQSQVLRLSEFAIELQQEAVQMAQMGKATLEESKEMAQERYEHYHHLYEENLSSLEISSISLKTASEVAKLAAAPFYVTGAALEVIPNIFGMAMGGAKYSSPVTTAAIIAQLTAESLDIAAERLQDGADYQRRRQEWEIEYKQAQSEINIIEMQLKEQELLIKSAQTALREAQAQQATARELYEFMTTGFLIVPTYQWLMGRLAALYAPAYDAVLSMCLTAERSWRYEVGDYQRQGFIKTTAWNDSYRGLLAGESLQLDLLQMESAWLQRNERHLNIKKTISLSDLLSGNELKNQIVNKKAVSFNLDSKLFDNNYPGHYLRQVKQISVSISLDSLNLDSVLSSEISAILTQTSSSTLTNADMDGVNWLYDPTRKAGNSKNVVNNLRAQQQIALSSLDENDDGGVAKENWLCTLMFDDNRYLPFEGTGAISTWTLEFPDQHVIDNIFYYPAFIPIWRLKDIKIHIHYTAVDGGKQFAKAVKDKIKKK